EPAAGPATGERAGPCLASEETQPVPRAASRAARRCSHDHELPRPRPADRPGRTGRADATGRADGRAAEVARAARGPVGAAARPEPRGPGAGRAAPVRPGTRLAARLALVAGAPGRSGRAQPRRLTRSARRGRVRLTGADATPGA